METRAQDYAEVDLAHLIHPLTDHSDLAEYGPLVLAN
jgi:hypothetical protein